MNLHTYDLVAPEYDKKINQLTNSLIDKFKKAITINSGTLIELIRRDTFDFISKSGNIIKIIDDKYIPVGKYRNFEIYVSVLDRNLIYFEKDTSLNLITPMIFSDSMLNLMFRDIDLFESIMHIVELNGILEKSIEYKSEQLKLLNNFINK